MLAAPVEPWQTPDPMEPRRTLLRFLAGRLAAYLAAVATAYVLATAGGTQFTVASLASMGVIVPPGDRLAMTAGDLAGMAGMFAPLVAFALLLALPAAALLARWLPGWRTALYLAAGGAALLAIHLGLQLAFGLTPVAAARSPGGLAWQALAGATGAYLYLRLVRRAGPLLG